MTWYVSFACYLIFLVTQSLWQRTYAKRSRLPETFPPALSYVLALMPLSLVVGLFLPHHIAWSGWLVFLLLVEGAFIGVFNWLMFMALRRLEVAKFEMILQIYTVVVIALGWTFLGEKLAPIQIVGGVLLLIAAYIAIRAPTGSDRELRKHADKRAVLIAVGAALTLGIGLVTEKAALQYMDTGAYFIVGFLTQTLALVLLAGKDMSRKSLRSIGRRDIQQSMIMGAQSALVGFSYIGAIQLSNNISLITILSTFSLPLTVLAGYSLLHERENMFRLFVATVLGCAGLIITAL